MTDPASAYHAHIYFDQDSREAALTLREQVAAAFPDLEIGRFHEREVGPHPKWSCQIAFPLEAFGTLIPWLMANRGSLTIFLHPLTGDDLADHRDLACWLGREETLKLEMFGA
ncbi:DOPA 4,5-dioxygenase family protein [Aestuariispira insulae]|nr:DOPA 4,5-dioxygenase family protein [Aestuariispira insulae]